MAGMEEKATNCSGKLRLTGDDDNGEEFVLHFVVDTGMNWTNHPPPLTRQ